MCLPVFLLRGRNLTSLWIPAVQFVFPYGHNDVWMCQKQVPQSLADMTFVRNRATNLEPIFLRDLNRD